MEKTKKTKLIIGLSYLLLITIFVFFLFSKFSLTEIKSFVSYDFIKENRLYFLELKNSNLFLVFLIFLIFTILWVFPFGIWFTYSSYWRVYFWKMDRGIICCFRFVYRCNFIIYFSNYFLKDLLRKNF